MKREILINRVYRHFKGDFYFVEGIAKNTETNEMFVVYRALYGNNDLYVRPYGMFVSKVDKQKYPNCLQEYRFELANIDSVKQSEVIAISKETLKAFKEVDKISSKKAKAKKYPNVNELRKDLNL